ncbi:MAG: hypothetical protein EPO11_04725 [Gammaproteobacteria bacterium]|nr:MAG: hypothetical protein EPO11_04725 [Gammaproteobacteria bacterium]
MGRRKKIEKELLDSPEGSPEARGLRVRRIRNMANLSRQQMCENTDININSLKGWEIGRYGGLTWYGAEKIIHQVAKEGVQCSSDWLMYGIGAGPSVQTGFVDTDIQPPATLTIATESTQNEDEKIANELALFKKQYKNAVDFIVADEGMSPLYHCGEYVGGINLFGQKIDVAVGLHCITQMENGNILLRQLRKGSEPNTYTLVCLNIDQTPEPVLYNVKLISAAPVIFHRKRNMVY